jgi:acetyltransferase-like isoleucine patch superfamily enzyme
MNENPLSSRLRSLGARIGSGVYLGRDVHVEEYFAPLLTIGDAVTISQGVTILLHDSSLNNVAGAPIVLGEVIVRANAYIGANCTIMCGVEIGEGSLVGAGALVTSDVPSGSVAYGVPASVVGTVEEVVARANGEHESAALRFTVPARPWRERSEEEHQALHRHIDDLIASLRESRSTDLDTGAP